jgi:hypothetical protein
VVYDRMLGLTSKASYERWTAVFNPTSTYEGSWDTGSKILFVGKDEEGNQRGMVSTIEEHRPEAFVSIKHRGLYHAGEEIMSGPEVEKWANGFENYTFVESNGVTTLTVDLDTHEEFTDFMMETYPKALEELKTMCQE